MDLDFVIVGGGIMGASAAYALASRGAKVALLEAHQFLHRLGSSHGESRIIRRTYPSSTYTRWMADSYRAWEAAEAESGCSVFEKTGGIDIMHKDAPTCKALCTASAEHDVEIRILSPAEAAAEYGLCLRPDEVAIYQADSGILRATAAVSMYLGLARKHGAHLRDRVRLQRLTREADGRVLVEASGPGGEFKARCKKVVLALGAWLAPAMEQHLNLKIHLQVWQTAVCYWRPKADAGTSDGAAAAASGAGAAPTDAGSAAAALSNGDRMRRLPVVIDYGRDPLWTSTITDPAAPAEAEEPCIYSCPSRDFPGLIKFAVHRGLNVTADSRTFEADHEVNVAPVQRWLGRVIPFLDASAPAAVETCMYTMSKDEDFILGSLPTEEGAPGAEWAGSVIIAGGGNGHAFKFGSVIGAAVADLCERGCSDFDLSPFRVDRPALELARVR